MIRFDTYIKDAIQAIEELIEHYKWQEKEGVEIPLQMKDSSLCMLGLIYLDKSSYRFFIDCPHYYHLLRCFFCPYYLIIGISCFKYKFHLETTSQRLYRLREWRKVYKFIGGIK